MCVTKTVFAVFALTLVCERAAFAGPPRARVIADDWSLDISDDGTVVVTASAHTLATPQDAKMEPDGRFAVQGFDDVYRLQSNGALLDDGRERARFLDERTLELRDAQRTRLAVSDDGTVRISGTVRGVPRTKVSTMRIVARDARSRKVALFVMASERMALTDGHKSLQRGATSSLSDRDSALLYVGLAAAYGAYLIYDASHHP